MVAPVLKQLAGDWRGVSAFAKLNVDENPMTELRFNFQSIPTLLVLKGGQEVDRIAGAYPKAEIVQRVERAIALR